MGGGGGGGGGGGCSLLYTVHVHQLKFPLSCKFRFVSTQYFSVVHC